MSADVIKGLEPSVLWERFYEITQVPRPSKKEEKILKYLKDWGDKNNIKYKQDEAGSMVFFVPATKGFENAPTVVLQGHVDMVCEKNNSTVHDFENDPLKIIRTDGWLKADGTTLGADNGIGVAAAMAIAEDKSFNHGPLEILCTIDEETGLTGANSLEPGFITGKTLLNLDSEEDGAFYVGCAGGIDTVATLDLETEPAPAEMLSYKLQVTGLLGGHSGSEINTGRGNAIKIIARALAGLQKFNYSIVKISGGNLRNAIPREAEAVILLTPSDEKNAVIFIDKLSKDIAGEYSITDSGVKIELKKAETKHPKVFTKEFGKKVVNVLLGLPHGVLSMSQDIPDLVETSTNLAVVSMDETHLKIATSQRSSIESSKEYVAQSVKAVLDLAGASVKTGDGYPGWKPDMNSKVLKITKDVYNELFGSEPEIKAIHAGLECGILGDKNPGMDMISFGPTITGAHSPDEKVEIKTVQKFYDLLKKILERYAKA
ncbi:MAG: aminoacyl-histidine dipeptidase [Methanococcaceae archaeon]